MALTAPAARRAIAAARVAAKTLRGVSVTYTRIADSSSSTITVTPARTETEAEGESGVVVTTVLHDWLINSSDLSAAPEAGDQIVWGSNRFEVVAIAGERCWQWHDSYRDSYRVHSVEVENVTEVLDEASYGNIDGDVYGNLDGDEYAFRVL